MTFFKFCLFFLDRKPVRRPAQNQDQFHVQDLVVEVVLGLLDQEVDPELLDPEVVQELLGPDHVQHPNQDRVLTQRHQIVVVRIQGIQSHLDRKLEVLRDDRDLVVNQIKGVFNVFI